MNRKKFPIPRIKVPGIRLNSQGLNNSEALLQELGLFPLPGNVEVKISDDNKYINFRLKDNNEGQNHLLFQIPLIAKDLSALYARTDYQELMDRYNIYTNEYIDEVKNYAIQERAYLKEKFPGLVFSIKIRIKSLESYTNKINKNILCGKDPYINDIMAGRVIITEYNGSQDEKELIRMCYEVAKALYDFRINTNFRMKQDDSEHNSAKTDKEYITKDYIAYPKENGYQSLHLLMQNKRNKNFSYETQIRTFEMESSSKEDRRFGHTEYKPRILNDLSVTQVPLYSVITQFDDHSGNPIILDAPFETRFYHFYNSSKTSRQNGNAICLPITYDNFKKEQEEIMNSLGVSFQDIRNRLKEINISKYIKSREETGIK